ncbi:hypothetical protein BCR16_00905 [Ralstonia solanacearum FJAT-1458]|nr:hypothetical protein BCR16_00905 [Ralstonia solanacearum FJAT-1458]
MVQKMTKNRASSGSMLRAILDWQPGNFTHSMPTRTPQYHMVTGMATLSPSWTHTKGGCMIATE